MFWSRAIGHEIGQYYLTGIEGSERTDVLHSLGVDAVRFVGRMDLSAKAILTANLNRNFQSDVYNMNMVIGPRHNF